MTWWGRLWRKGQMEEQLEKELRFHVEQHARDLMASGTSEREAYRRARLEMGGPEQVKESCRDARGTRWLDDLWQDSRYALRALRNKPGFAAVAILTLALGTGATTVMFTVIDSVLLKPLPYPEADRLVAIHTHTPTWNVAAFGEQRLAYFDFRDCRQESRTLDLAGWIFNSGTMSAPGDAEYVVKFEASSNLFPVLGARMYRGRAFDANEDRPGGAPVAVLGYSFWQRRFAGSSAAVGKALVVDGQSYTIVGVAPPRFQVDGNEPDLYTPIGQNTTRWTQSRRPHPVGVIARLQNGATLQQARAELAGVGQNLAVRYPDTNRQRSFVVQPLHADVSDVRSTLWLLLGAVSLVLLIACVNVASLMLARAVSRQRELALRVALGAGRARLVRQCLTESMVLAIAGGALGVGLAAAGLRPFVAFWPGSLPRAEEIALDWRVLLFALAASLFSGLLFGIAPALRAGANGLDQALRAGGRSLGASSRRLHSGYVVAEIALAVVLLVSAGMLGRTLLHLSALDPGVNLHNVLVARMALSPSTLSNPAKIRAAWQDVLDRTRRVPGVESAATVDTVPMRSGNNQLGYWTSAALPPENQQPLALANSVSPDYLKVMGIRLLDGRFFDDRDRLGSDLVVVIDEVLAQSAFGRSGAVGKQLWIPSMDPKPQRVIGVVRHVRHWGLAGDDQATVRAQVYYPFAQVPDALLRRWSELMSLAVRTNTDPLTLVQPLRRELRGAANDQVLYQVHTMEELAGDSLARQRFLLRLFGIFACLALLLACIGISGVLAYLTGQRFPEIGVRMALGATRGEVLRIVLRQSLGMILLGAGIGAAAAIAAARVMRRAVQGMEPIDPLTLAVPLLVLLLAAMAASFIPARRASRIDPLGALRQE